MCDTPRSPFSHTTSLTNSILSSQVLSLVTCDSAPHEPDEISNPTCHHTNTHRSPCPAPTPPDTAWFFSATTSQPHPYTSSSSSENPRKSATAFRTYMFKMSLTSSCNEPDHKHDHQHAYELECDHQNPNEHAHMCERTHSPPSVQASPVGRPCPACDRTMRWQTCPYCKCEVLCLPCHMRSCTHKPVR